MSSYSEELINAYIDGELDGDEREKIRFDAENNQELADYIKQRCQLRKSIIDSYAHVASHADVDDNQGYNVRYKLLGFAAVIMLFVLGGVSGWFLHLETADHSVNGFAMNAAAQQPNKIVLHISSADPSVMSATMQKVTHIVEQSRAKHKDYQLEVVANSDGINLFRKGVSPFRDQILHLMKTDQRVSFIACANALERMRLEGQHVELLSNDIQTHKTALNEIIQRIREGWVYIKV